MMEQYYQNLFFKYLKVLEDIKSYSPHTLRAYQQDLKELLSVISMMLRKGKDSFANNSGDSLDEVVLIKSAQKLQIQWGRLALASRNRKSASIKALFKWLYHEKYISQDLSLKVICPSVPKKLPRFLSLDEVIAIISELKNLNINHIDEIKCLFYLLYGAGLRVSEACHLRSENVQLSQCVLKVLGKSNKERLVVYPKILNELLPKLLNKKQKYIWGEKPLNTRTAYEWIRVLGARVHLLQPIHPHALRHSYATHLLSSGANLRILQSLLGHTSLQATEKYTHLDLEQLAQVMQDFHPLSKRNIHDES